MELKDLTKAQATEILKLIYPFPDSIVSDVEHKYSPPDRTDNSDGYYTMKFQSNISLHNIHKTVRVIIYPNLDCEIDFIKKMAIRGYFPDGRLPVHNQKLIQEAFKKFGLQ